MALIVQKFGGTSVGTVERIQSVAQRILKTVKEDNQVIVVVSAMGKTTDTLVNLANAISTKPSRREMDMLLSTGEQVTISLLSMALQEIGQSAISLTGAQVGIVTEAEYGRARILEVKTSRIERHLNQGKVIVVAGFQGVCNQEDLEITTLGRGGSDTSAVALAVALGASKCEIYTDVPGILTTDPRIVPEAQLMEEITADEMLELASLGANVLHPRAVEIARNYGMPLVVRSSWSDEPGTKILTPTTKPLSIEGLEITKAVDGVEFDIDQGKVALLRVPDFPGVAARLFGEIASNDIDVDLIIQSIHEENTNDIAFTVAEDILEKARKAVENVAPLLRNESEIKNQAEVSIDPKIAKVSIAGAGMIGRPGIAAKMFQTLADAQVNIEMISTSEVKVSCLIAQESMEISINALCKAFDIASSPLSTSGVSSQSSIDTAVRGVALDKDQARLALLNIRDQPGMAAKIFGLLSRENISVDMIIQSQRCRVINGVTTRDLAFTVSQDDAIAAKNILEEIKPLLIDGEILVDQNIAKVSIVGSGMINQPGVASRFFEALAKNKINISMIATSEIKISCVIDQDQSNTAVMAVHKAFNLGKLA